MKNKPYKYFIMIIWIILLSFGIGYFYKVNTSFWGSADPVGTWWHRQVEKPKTVNFDILLEYSPYGEISNNAVKTTEKYTVTVNKKEQTIFIKKIESESSEISSCLMSIKDKNKLKIELTSTFGETETFEKSCDTDLFSKVFFVSKYSDIFKLEEPLSSKGNDKHFSATGFIPGDALNKLLCEMLETEKTERRTAFIEAEAIGLNKYEGYVTIKNCGDIYQELHNYFTNTNTSNYIFEEKSTINCEIYFY